MGRSAQCKWNSAFELNSNTTACNEQNIMIKIAVLYYSNVKIYYNIIIQNIHVQDNICGAPIDDNYCKLLVQIF